MAGKDPSVTKELDVPNMGDLKLKCPSCCDKIFDSKQALVEHLTSILDNVICPICCNKWSSLAHLIEHLSLDNCQPGSTALISELVGQLGNINVGEVKVSPQTGLEGPKGEILHTDGKDQKELTDAFSPSIKDPAEEGSDMGRMYVEFLSKQLAKPCLQTQELKLVKDGDVSRYVLVTNEDSNLELDGSSTVVTKQNTDGTISLTVEDMKVECTHAAVQEGQESTEEEGQEIYSCNTCGVSFTSVLDHIQNYHNDQDVVVEEPMDDMDPSSNEIALEEMDDPLNETIDDAITDKMASRRMITETGDIVEAPIYLKNASLGQPELHRVPEPQIKEEVMDKLGRTYTRRYVVVDKMCDPVIKDIKQPDEKSGPYHKVVIKEMETTQGEKIKVFHCMSCNTYVSNLDDFKSRPCKQLKYTCPHCPVAYENHRSLCAHMKVHKMRPDFILDETMRPPSQFECVVCNTVFTTHKSLKLHKRMHDPVKARPIEPPVKGVDGGEVSLDQFLCSVCDKLIPMDYRAIHVASHKKNRQEFHCDICNKLFHSRAYLEMHMSVHSAEKTRVDTQDKSLQYQCVYCSRRFARPHEKVKHERIHTGEKPHCCEICGKSFRVSYCLTLHMRTHTGARPYECQHCGKRFKAHSVYNHHMLTHSDVRAYKCSYCPKAFKTAVQLAGHKNSHTKPFSCRHCNRPFASLYAVRVHTETHNRQNNLKFVCSLCGASYARAFALKDHMKQVHNNQMDKVEQITIVEKDVDWTSPDVISITDGAHLKNLSNEVDITELTVNIANDIAVP